ncbi:PEP/pyruvate-binding domain-containing protein [Paraburkholderia sp. UYCP14C]|uniref:PEP/pyruvate-binding domain-containing protein n=1 Tax=Paraburkholderia sp. UYCP14C TaxID=2511130 RepID=UPI0020071806|nr:PEP/pyruvate-binding domain-containing protein [Paraburkholderia sp. UYCP14C]
MADLGLPVPPAFVLGTPYCRDDALRKAATSSAVWGGALQELERTTGKRFGDTRQPLLLSVRSGAPISMPGMMDTLLDIGVCDATIAGLLRQTGNPRLVWDTYSRLVASYGELVANVPAKVFETEREAIAGERDEQTLDFAELRELTHRCLVVYERASGQPFPQDPRHQLAGAIDAVLRSWQLPKAVAYRSRCGIGDAIGTAVTIQAMVFGNAGGRSGAGVGFTRDPVNGEPSLWVDFLFNAQGEDVVSGRRSARGHQELARTMPAVWASLRDAAAKLERAFGDMQDFEFTVQDGCLYMLQARNGKRTPQAAARIALDMLDEGIITTATARERTKELSPADLVRTRIAAPDGHSLIPLAHAASATSGVAMGEIALDEARARERHAAGAAVILVRRDAETDDIAALDIASGLLTQRGARTSHAAVVARQLGKVCLVGCAMRLDEPTRRLQIGETWMREGDLVTLDSSDGSVYAGAVQTIVEPLVELQSRLARLRAP